MQDWYVITGGPATGKSTLIDLLAAKGYKVVPEAARAIVIQEQQKDSSYLPWKDLQTFQDLVAQAQWSAEQSVLGQEAFLDRSLVDGYAYCKFGNVKPPARIAEHARGRYKKIFLLEPLPDYVNDGQRSETREFRDAIQPLLCESYQEFGYQPIDVPVLPPQERVDFILKHIAS